MLACLHASLSLSLDMSVREVGGGGGFLGEGGVGEIGRRAAALHAMGEPFRAPRESDFILRPHLPPPLSITMQLYPSHVEC